MISTARNWDSIDDSINKYCHFWVTIHICSPNKMLLNHTAHQLIFSKASWHPVLFWRCTSSRHCVKNQLTPTMNPNISASTEDTRFELFLVGITHYSTVQCECIQDIIPAKFAVWDGVNANALSLHAWWEEKRTSSEGCGCHIAYLKYSSVDTVVRWRIKC